MRTRSSSTNTLRHLRTKLDLETVKTVGNTLLQEYTLNMLPEQVEIVVDLHLRPYYGDEDETDGLYYNEAKDVNHRVPRVRDTVPAFATSATHSEAFY